MTRAQPDRQQEAFGAGEQQGPVAVVLTALSVEYEAVRAHLTSVQTLVHPSGTRAECGRFAGTSWQVALAETGEGTLTAAALTERFHTWLRPQVLLFVGVAGGLKDDIEVGDVVVATKVYGIHGGKQTPHGFLVRPEAWRTSHRLEQAARHALRGRAHFKPIAVGDVVLADAASAIVRHLNEHYNDAVAIEMEGAGVAQAAHLTGDLDALIIRGISGKADAHKHQRDAEGSQQPAAHNAAQAAVALLQELTGRPASGSGAGTGGQRGDVGPGRPIGEWDPHALEVHPAGPTLAESGALAPGRSTLPGYVAREHDRVLARAVRDAGQGRSRMVVLVGTSSTGKTRACWEAVQPLAEKGWRLWHPFDPTRAEAALEELQHVGPRTVVWLNEAQHYLGKRADGERIAAAVHQLLVSPQRGPVLVLGTLWPEYARQYTSLPTPGEEDPHSRVRELLSGCTLSVPDSFDAGALAKAVALAEGGDRLLADAVSRARANGRITQDLAGAPELLKRYLHATPAAMALLEAAMDARRLGAGLHLPQAFLIDAATDYLSDIDYDQLTDDWAERALAELAEPVHGKQAPLRRTSRRPSRRGSPIPAAGAPFSHPAGPLFRLADFLEEHGRHHRVGQLPPVGFWGAAADHVRPVDLHTLGETARRCGLYREAAQLFKTATARGGSQGASDLVHLLHSLHPADHRPAEWVAANASVDDPFEVTTLLRNLWRGGTVDQAAALATRAAAHAALDDPWAVAHLLFSLHYAGAHTQAAALLARAPAAHVALDDGRAVANLLYNLMAVGAEEQAAVLLARDPAGHVPLDSPSAVADLLEGLQRIGAHDQVAILATRAAAHVSLDDPRSVAEVLDLLHKAGAHKQVAALLARNPAAHVRLDAPDAVAVLLDGLHHAGADHHAAVLLARDPATHAALDDGRAVAVLLESLRNAGADEQVTTLSTRAVEHMSLDDHGAMVLLLGRLRETRQNEDGAALTARALARVPIHDSVTVADLLYGLRNAGADSQVADLLAREPAAHVALDDGRAVAVLLGSLLDARASHQVAALLARDPATHITLNSPIAVALLLDRLRDAGASHQVAVLLARDPATHVPLDSPTAVADLLDCLRDAEADHQVTELAARAAAHAPLDDPRAVAVLLDSLRAAAAHTQVAHLATRAAAHMPLGDPAAVAVLLDSLRAVAAHPQMADLAARLPAAGLFDQFIKLNGHQEHFRFGRNTDGCAALPWTWEDLP
ncbi:hypothetical protein [Streptomyces sp. NPDC005017]|uniref:phosphorylase family protein n=1 Tax=Streptomyces sp. NPDC005017 TaxID=3364706 RepID=UPI0036BA2912